MTNLGALLAAATPSLVTLLGHTLTLLWLCGGPWPLAVGGLLCDAMDGWLARGLGQTSALGSEYDWLVDTTTVAILLAGFAPALLLLVVPLQALNRAMGWRFCGRTLLTLLVLGVQALALRT